MAQKLTFNDSDMSTPDILSEVSEEMDRGFTTPLLTDPVANPKKLLVKFKKNKQMGPERFKSTYEQYLNKTEVRNILHSKHRERW